MTKTLTPALSQRERERCKSPLHSLCVVERLSLHSLSLWERVRVRAAP